MARDNGVFRGWSEAEINNLKEDVKEIKRILNKHMETEDEKLESLLRFRVYLAGIVTGVSAVVSALVTILTLGLFKK